MSSLAPDFFPLLAFPMFLLQILSVMCYFYAAKRFRLASFDSEYNVTVSQHCLNFTNNVVHLHKQHLFFVQLFCSYLHREIYKKRKPEHGVNPVSEKYFLPQ